jgi:phenylpyruvate tautomerase PptA (4-oxalocrotonate tautomerase family)
MPLIQVTAAQGALNKNEQDTLMSRLSNAVLKSERAPVDDPAAQSLVWAYFHEVPEGAVYVGGENLKQAPILIAVTTPEGALNEGGWAGCGQIFRLADIQAAMNVKAA